MSVIIKPEPGSPERGLPPPCPAARGSRTRPAGDDDGLNLYEPETHRVPARRGGGAAGKKKTPASGPKKAAADKEWNYTYMPASNEQRKKNGRVEGRNLITWNRKLLYQKYLVSTKKSATVFDTLTKALGWRRSSFSILCTNAADIVSTFLGTKSPIVFIRAQLAVLSFSISTVSVELWSPRDI